MTGILEILNVQKGDITIVLDKGNTAEVIRAKRIITDMLRRGYALVVEVERDGKKAYERVQEFDAEKGEYIIADFDPEAHELAPRTPEETAAEDPIVAAVERGAITAKPAKGPDPTDTTKCTCGRPVNHRGMCKGVTRSRRLGMTTTLATAIGRSSGG